MRTRMLKPGFFTNEDLADLPYEYRLLFAGLWCIADREGRLEDRPKRIRRELFGNPDDRINVDEGLSQLAAAGFIARYTAEGKACVAIPSFRKHQNPHRREAISTLPEYERDSPRPVPGTTKDMARHDQGQDEPGGNRYTVTGNGTNSPNGETSDSGKPNPTRQVFEAWVATLAPGTRRELTKDRADKIRTRLKTYPLDEVIDAVQGWPYDPWKERVNQNELEILLRSDRQCEKFRDLYRDQGKRKTLVPMAPDGDDAAWSATLRAANGR